MADDLGLTVREAAKRIGLGLTATRQEIAAGRLGCLRIGPRGAKIRVTEEDIAAYLERCRSIRPATGRRQLKFIKARPASA